jgi:hypothetical protein
MAGLEAGFFFLPELFSSFSFPLKVVVSEDIGFLLMTPPSVAVLLFPHWACLISQKMCM